MMDYNKITMLEQGPMPLYFQVKSILEASGVPFEGERILIAEYHVRSCPEPYNAASVSLTPIMATIFLLQIIAAARGRGDAGELLWNRRRSSESCFCEGGLPPILSDYGRE
jgi:hypothetical protein